MAIPLQRRRDTAARWAAANPVIPDGQFCYEKDTLQFKIGNGTSHYADLPYGGVQGPAQTNSIQCFGTGLDGDVTLTSGSMTLIRDMYYNNLTVSGTARSEEHTSELQSQR